MPLAIIILKDSLRSATPPGEAKGGLYGFASDFPNGILRTAPDPSGAMRPHPREGGVEKPRAKKPAMDYMPHKKPRAGEKIYKKFSRWCFRVGRNAQDGSKEA